ncbi:MAG TPA: acetoacetate decarboxylase family protein [Solirubrobacteraceae bacterium]
MGFVKTPAEIERIERELSAPRWSGEWLSVQFLTERTTHARLLPPPLQPCDEPLAAVTVGRWQSNCLGDFTGAVVNLAAQYEGVEGSYVLALYMGEEPPIVFGREVFGEPKKWADSSLLLHGDRARAWVTRGGRRLIELHATLGDELGPSSQERCTYNYKARTATGGRGLEEDAILTRTRFEVEVSRRRTGAGTVSLTSGPHDPLGELEVVEVRHTVYCQDVAAAHCAAVATVPAERFLPYHYGRQDDWSTLNTLDRVPA